MEASGLSRRPKIHDSNGHNGHLYYLLLRNLEERTAFIEKMRGQGVSTVFHYVPLHSSPQGRLMGRTVGDLAVTTELADRLVRLPMWVGLEEHQEEVIAKVGAVLHGA